ncbi:hypothetical protein BJ138DRAFT_763770 [Hygrophoropsis aurantiaca]|uniref:Uncharacterized protein n=1 Tax=Hygrophoropsis aurantiaca TaxID=72124 RepID=A0ACB8AUD8_9AGAM|nr:hypothetical protein BJ138DRAFT_763770 [Hygrophoropsis aurantiaca]
MSVEIENAGDALRNIARKLGTNKVIQNNLNNSLSSFVLLKSSTLSIPAHQKLAATIEKLFPPLYPLHLQESIRLANAVISYILQEKISDVSTVDIKSKAAWDSIVTQMLSGILDFIENNADGVDFSSSFAGLAVISSIARSKEHVAEALYPLLCGFFVDLPTKCKMSVALRNNAYDLLSETVSSHAINQSKLRDKKLLGGERIGYMLSQTKDFILLESLLTLVAWLLPSIKQNSGKAKRTHFIQEVFGSSKWFLCSSEIIQILQNVSTSAWEHTAAKIIDALARSDITFPQPFSLEEIDVCGTVFVQPTDSDRLNMDSQVFFGNIIRNDDTFESFRVPYTSVSSVAIDKSNESAPEGRASIIVHLTSAPLVGNDIMVLKKGEDTSLKFLLHNEDLGRFMETLRRRGVGKLSFHDDSTSNGVKSPQNIYLGSGLKFFDENTSSPIPPRSSFEDKFQHVEQVYRTNERENTPEPEFLVCADSRDNATILTPQDNRLSSGKQVDTIQLTRNFSKLSPVMKLTHQQSFDPEITPIPPASTPIAPSSVKAISKRILRESDDELFDISKDDVPQVRPVVPIRSIKHTPSKKATAKEITVKTIPTAPATRLRGRKIVDSDDEALMSIPHKQTIKRIAHVDTDIDNVFSSQAPNIDRKSLADVRSSSTIVAREEASHAAGAQRNDKSAEVTRTSVSIDAQLKNIAVLREDPVIIIPASPVKQMSVAKNSASVLDSVSPPVTPEMTAGRNPPLKSTKTRVRPKARNTRSKAAKTDPAVLNGPIPVAETPGIQMSPVPVKLAGKRRKRETPEPSAHYDFGTDSEAPLRKKTRSDSKVEVATLDRQSDPLEPNVSHSVRPKKRYGRKGRSSPIVAQVDDHSDDVPKNPRTLRSSLRSTKVNLDRAPHGRETRAAAMRGKAGKTNIIRPYVLERQLEIETMDTYLRQSVPPRTQKDDIKAPPHISSIPAHEDKFHARSQASVATAIQTSKEGHPKRDTEALPAELATLVAPLDKVQPISQPQHNEKTPKVKSKKAPRDEMPIIAPYIKSDNDSSVSFELSVNDISPMDEIHKETASNAQDYTYIEYYSPLKGSEDSVGAFF